MNRLLIASAICALFAFYGSQVQAANSTFHSVNPEQTRSLAALLGAALRAANERNNGQAAALTPLVECQRTTKGPAPTRLSCKAEAK